jgi:hypothetical protein
MARTDLSYINNATDQNQFERLGHPGKYTNVIRYTGGQTDFTGSNYGYGSLIVKTHGSATASLSGGGHVILEDLTGGVVYDFSVSKISGGSSAIVYVLKRQQ